MSQRYVRCGRDEDVYQAFDRARADGLFPADATVRVTGIGIPHPEAGPGTVKVGEVTVRTGESFAVVVPEVTVYGEGRGTARTED